MFLLLSSPCFEEAWGLDFFSLISHGYVINVNQAGGAFCTIALPQ
jgi:hypothetical protein